MASYQLPTGTYETRAAFAVRGGSFRDKRHFAAIAILVRHPKGDLLIDAGFGSGIAAHLAVLPRIQRAPHQATETVSEQLDASGYDRSRLLGVLVTHPHRDHVSGLDELPVPIWMNSGEREYAAEDPGGRSSAPCPRDTRSTNTRSADRPISVLRRASTCMATALWSSPSQEVTRPVPWLSS
jgi:glyoxylase-like metal-dependent hydrolase (beta-lactamase superfamily II)